MKKTYLFLILSIFSFTAKGQFTAMDSSWSDLRNSLINRNDRSIELIKFIQKTEKSDKTLFNEIFSLNDSMKSLLEKSNALDSLEINRLNLLNQNFSNKVVRALINIEADRKLASDEKFISYLTILEGAENRVTVETMHYNKKAESLGRKDLIFVTNEAESPSLDFDK